MSRLREQEKVWVNLGRVKMAADGDSAVNERVALSSRLLVVLQAREGQDGGVGYFGRMRRVCLVGQLRLRVVPREAGRSTLIG
jgi:hypothetical protein